MHVLTCQHWHANIIFGQKTHFLLSVVNGKCGLYLKNKQWRLNRSYQSQKPQWCVFVNYCQTYKWIYHQSVSLKSFVAWIQTLQTGWKLSSFCVWYLWSFNHLLIKKTVQTVSGWCVPLDRSRLPESRLCFIVREREELDPWPGTRTTGFLWAEPAFPRGLRLQTTRGDWVHSTLGWLKGRR